MKGGNKSREHQTVTIRRRLLIVIHSMNRQVLGHTLNLKTIYVYVSMFVCRLWWKCRTVEKISDICFVIELKSMTIFFPLPPARAIGEETTWPFWRTEKSSSPRCHTDWRQEWMAESRWAEKKNRDSDLSMTDENKKLGGKDRAEFKWIKGKLDCFCKCSKLKTCF